MGTLANSEDPDEMQQNIVCSQNNLQGPRYSKTCYKRPLRNKQNKGLKGKW